MTVALAAAVSLGIALPHLLRLERVAPVIAVAIWLGALGLRAVTGVLVVVLAVFYLPATELFGLLTHWCWHAVVPFLATHVGLSGHAIGDAATLLPAAAISASAFSVGWALVRAARAVRQVLRQRALGRGPDGSVIVGGPDVVIAAAGLARPKVVVSAGALTQLDDSELAASLDHERGHIAHGHRVVLLFGEVCRALGRFVPGTRRAVAELTFHLERDADAYAVARRHDPLALASAICKAAALHHQAPTFNPLADGRSVVSRVRVLSEPTPNRHRLLERSVGCVASAMLALTLWLAVAAPSFAASGGRELARTPAVHNCRS